MKLSSYAAAILTAAGLAACAEYSLEFSKKSPYSLTILNNANKTVLTNSAILAGQSNETMAAIGEGSEESSLQAEMISPSVARVRISSSLGFTGATFDTEEGSSQYGVWTYPWNNSISNHDIHFDLKGLQGNDGINYASARSPFFISSAGYAVYTDTMAMGSYAFYDEDQEVRFIFNTTELVYYMILPAEEGDIKSLLTQYAELTDTSPLWYPGAYGPMFWHNDFQRESGFPDGVDSGQEFVMNVADSLSREKIRASAIMVDRPFGTGTEGWGNFDFDQDYWPDIEAMIAELAGRGIDFQLWVANRAVPGSELHDKGLASEGGDWLFSEMVTEEDASIAYNLSIPAAYDYFKDRMAYFTSVGTRGYKIDRGDEDEMPVWEQNVQAFLFHKLLWENMVGEWGLSRGPEENSPPSNGSTTPTAPEHHHHHHHHHPSVPFYNFARSLSDRSRQYTGVWAADPESTADGLAASIRHGIRSGLLGFPMWGSDCGGYTRDVDEVQPTEDVWARWMWFSAFSPVYEVMLYEGSVPWDYYYGEEDSRYTEELVAVLRETTRLHHELIPFIQSYILRATGDGLPVIRALFLEAPGDERAWDEDVVGDEYFFGEEFLVTPIVGGGGNASRTVYFPEGGRYVDYFDTGNVYEGGQEVTVTRDLHSVPCFVREGAIIPRGDLYRANYDWDDDWKPWMNIDVYPGLTVSESSFVLYLDEQSTSTEIRMTTDSSSGETCVSYGAIYVDGFVVVHLEGAEAKVPIRPLGGEDCVLLRDIGK